MSLWRTMSVDTSTPPVPPHSLLLTTGFPSPRSAFSRRRELSFRKEIVIAE